MSNLCIGGKIEYYIFISLRSKHHYCCSIDLVNMQSQLQRIIHDATPQKKWYLLNSGICGVKPAQFLSQSSTTKKFPSEFARINVSQVKHGNGEPLEETTWFNRSWLSKNNEVSVASPFGVLAAVTRQNNPDFAKAGICGAVEMINNSYLDEFPPKYEFSQNDAQMQTEPVSLFEDIELNSQIGKKKRKANTNNEKMESQMCYSKRKKNGEHETQWRALNDVCDKYKVSLAKVIGEQVNLQNDDALDMLSKIAEQITSQNGIKRAFEDMLGDSSKAYLQSLSAISKGHLIGHCFTSSWSREYQMMAGKH